MSETREQRRERRHAEADARDRRLIERDDIVKAAREALDRGIDIGTDPAIRVALRVLFDKVRVHHDPEEGPVTVVVGPNDDTFVDLARAVVMASQREPCQNRTFP